MALPPAFGTYDEHAKTFTVTEDSQYARWLRGQAITPIEYEIEAVRRRVELFSKMTFD